jgi:nucleotide-binding universal stress UspA family protein
MFTTIVWASDGSEHADRALAYAIELARSEAASLQAVHVVEKLVGPRIAGQNVSLNEGEIDAKIK